VASTKWDGVWTSFSDPKVPESTRRAFLEGLQRDRLPETWRCDHGHETLADKIGLSTGAYNNAVTPLPVCSEPGCLCIGDEMTAVG
jgi:hypothetical protein